MAPFILLTISLRLHFFDLHTGSTFHINMQFQTMNGTGTGEIDLLIDTVDGIPVGQNQLIEPLQAGMYNVTWNVDAKPDPNCDPTQQFCEMWEVGAYQANVGEWSGKLLVQTVYLVVQGNTKWCQSGAKVV